MTIGADEDTIRRLLLGHSTGGRVEPDARRDAQSVEIVIAVVLGSLIAFGPTIVLGLVELAGGPEWSLGHTVEFIVPSILGGVIVLWWLIRARQSGL